MRPDHVDDVVEQWRRERPDVDVSGMAVVARIIRLERLMRPLLNEVLAEHDLEFWEFDVLATLRRAGTPYRLSAGQLLDSLMIASGTMTNRLDRLEQRGLLRRTKDPDDGRLVVAELTDQGLAQIDAAIVDHAANEAGLVGALTRPQQQTLIALLRRLEYALQPD